MTSRNSSSVRFRRLTRLVGHPEEPDPEGRPDLERIHVGILVDVVDLDLHQQVGPPGQVIVDGGLDADLVPLPGSVHLCRTTDIELADGTAAQGIDQLHGRVDLL